jgi:hypothetical protein
MRNVAVFGAVVASMVMMFAGPAAAHRIPKPFQCVPIEGNMSPAYGQTCDVWWANGEFAGSCECEPGFALFDPINSLLEIEDDGSSGGGYRPPKASGS